MKVEIVDVRPIQAATAKGTMETHHMVYYRVEDGPVEHLEVPQAEITRKDALAAIQEHLKWRGKITGTYQI